MSGTTQAPPCLIVAEAGVNHGGSVDTALALVEAAADAGAHAVKFQSFRTELLVRDDAPQAAYQRCNAPATTQAEMLRALELTPDAHRLLAERCVDRGIEFLSTPFDAPSLAMLVGLGVRRLKVASGELTNGPMLLRMARTGLPMMVSTGMATLEEIADALAVIAFGREATEGDPTTSVRADVRRRMLAGSTLLDGVTLLHCTSSYPAPADSVNLRAMATLRETFDVPVGYSDHTEGIEIALTAVALGATAIEKHLTLDRSLPGPDHRASLDPDGFAALVAGVATVTAALGSATKGPQAAESDVRDVARRGLVAAVDLSPDRALTETDLVALRPAQGLPPMALWDVVGTHPEHRYRAGEPFQG